MGEKKQSQKLGLKTCEISDRFKRISEIQNDTEIFSPNNFSLAVNANKIDWLDQYTNAHRIAEENVEFMRKWILKIPLNDLLNELNINYVGKMDAFSCEDHRHQIQEYINDAIEDDDIRYLIYAYTAATSFYRQLNIDLAKRGSTFRFESQLSDRSNDDQVPANLGEYLFTACLMHHPSVDRFYQRDCTTHRGVNMTRWELEQYIPGARILVRSFLSSSKLIKIAKIYFDLVSEEKIPVLCTYHITQSRTAMSIQDISRFSSEEEVLILPFAVFCVVKVQQASLDCDEQRRVRQVVLEELPSTTERWEISNNQLHKTSVTDSYDSQGRLNSAETSLSRLQKKTTPISTEYQKTEEFVSIPFLTTNINQIIDEILPSLSRNANVNADQLYSFHSIKQLISIYCLAEYSIWSLPLLKRLYYTVCTIKQLLEEHENGKNYDVAYLKILIVRVQQRTANIDYGVNFIDDGPYILEQLEYEDILDERRRCKSELLPSFQERFVSQCSLYVQKCIDLHSYIRIMGIGKDNIEQLTTQLNITSITLAEKKHLSQKCDPLTIPLRSFVSCATIDSNVSYHLNGLSFIENQRHFLTDNIKQQTLANDSRDLYRLIAETPFLPSSEFNLHWNSSSSSSSNRTKDNIFDILDQDRWIVILGDPGSAKTTLTRWLTLVYAKKFMENVQNNSNNLSARLPVLIRVGQIANALDRDASLSLLDCLCQPAWFGISLISNDYDQLFIREYIKHGHAIIILDGLDEIPNFRQRQHIVRLIKQFLEEWTVCPVTFISPFDKFVLNDRIKPLSCSTIGNQVIITSRIVGYYSCPIASHRIKHYVLDSLSLPVMNSFIDHWFENVYLSLDISQWTTCGIVTNLCTLGDELKLMLSNMQGLQKLASNPMMLALLCTLSLLQSQKEMFLLRKQRICLLDTMSKFTLKSCSQQTENADVVLDLLIDIAVFLHERSPSGLVEELDMKNILRRSLSNREDIIDNFIRLIDSETCLFVPRGLCIYGFSHLTYEEYYVCLHILRINDNVMKYNRLESVAHQFHRYALYGARFREPLILALSYISWQWSESEYHSFCDCLLDGKDTNQFDNLIPLGAICLLSSIPELVRLPSTQILCVMLNQCIGASAKNKWFDHFPAFTAILRTTLNELPSVFIQQWFLAASDDIIDAIGQFILQIGALPSWFDQDLSHRLWNQLTLENYRLRYCLFPFTANLNQTLLPKNDLYQYMTANGVQIESIHPLILVVMICLCEGLTRSQTDQDIVTFSPEWMHRHSEYSSVLIQYLSSDPQALLNYCHNELLSKSSPPSVDLLIMCCCLEGCKDEMLTLPLIQRLQQLALYVCSVYLGKQNARNMHKPFTDQILTLLEPLIDCCEQDASPCSSSLIVIIALSRLLSIRENNFPHIKLPYKLCHLNEDQLNSDLFILSRSFQPDLIPAAYRHLLSSQSLSLTHRTFLSAAYIIELSIDAYKRWSDLNTRKSVFTEDSIQEILTVEIAQWINTRIQVADEEECFRLSQALHRCKTFTDVRTADILTQWLSYDTSSNLREFAYHAAILLFNLNVTATVLCCQLLGSEFDDFRQRSEKLFKNNIVSSWRLGLKGLISFIEIYQNWISTSVAAHILESFNTIQIRLERMHSLNSLYILLENTNTVNILGTFSFIFDLSIQSTFITKLENCQVATKDYISTILNIFSRSKGKWNKFEVNRGIIATFRLLRKYSNSIEISNVALTIFTRWRSYNYIKHIILQSCYPENTRIQALRWFYKTRKCRSCMKLLQRLRSTASSSITDVIWEGFIYLECIDFSRGYGEPSAKNLVNYCDNDHLRFFRTLIALRNDSADIRLIGCYDLSKIFEEMRTEHEFEGIDTVFADTICHALMNAQKNSFSTLSDTHLVLAVEYIERREIKFFRAVHNSVLGEQGFKNALIIIGKKSVARRRLAALSLLVCYGELTMEIVQIFLELALEKLSDQQRACRLIWRLKRIPNKQTSEYLLDKLENESVQQRYMAALLLVQLAVNDQISMNTVCKHIKNVINDPTSVKDIYLTSEFFTICSISINDINKKGRLDHALATLLLQFSFIAGKPSSNEFNSYTHYIDFYLKYNHLFEQIRQAPRLVTCHYEPPRISDDYDSDY